MAEESNVTSTETPPLTNSEAARTPDGTLKDQSTSTSTSTAEPKKDDGATVSKSDAAKSGAPEKYDAFSAPEGRTLDAALVDKATPIFKELGLDQASAQRLVDFFNETVGDQATAMKKVMDATRDGWVAEVKADKEMSGKLDQIGTDIGRLKDQIFGGDKAAREAFDNAMNLTGAGDHPAFVKTFWKIAKAMSEGSYVSGGGPSQHGQKPPGASSRPSLAAAMYPNLTRQ